MGKLIYQLHTYFNSIDLKYYGFYMDSKNELKKITEGMICWDILSHNFEENEKYIQLNSQIQEYSYISIIFRHISIEGLINDIIIRYIGEEKFKLINQNRKIRWLDKIQIVYKLVSKKDFPKGGIIYSNLKDLDSVRNTLTHTKSVIFDFEKISTDDIDSGYKEYFSAVNKMTGNNRGRISAQKDYTEVVEETRTVYDDLSELFYKELQNRKEISY